MLLLAQGMPNWAVGTLVALFFLVCVLMILAVLIQRPQGGGLSGAFGAGAGSGQTAFGAKTGDALTFVTILVFILYLATAVGLNYALRSAAEGGAQTREESSATAPAEENLAQPDDGVVPATEQPQESPADDASVPPDDQPDTGESQEAGPGESSGGGDPTADPGEEAPPPPGGA